MKFECSKCGYKFERKKMPPHCPYCSKEGSVTEAKLAQELLDETISDTGFMKRE